MPETRRVVLESRAHEAKLLGARLAAARTSAGLTQLEAAGVLGVAQSRIAKLELGAAQLRFIEGLRLAAAYRIDPRWLGGDSAAEQDGDQAR